MNTDAPTVDELNRCRHALEANQNLFSEMVEQVRGDWTSTEEGQEDCFESFEDFLAKEKKHEKRLPQEGQVIGLFSIGNLPEIISLKELAELVQAYFSLPMRFLPKQEPTWISDEAWRSILCFVPQANANLILWQVLEQQRQNPQCFATVAITHEDLLDDPKDDGDYVYGLSRMNDGVAVISTRRICRPEVVGTKLSRLRFFKLITHEIGHLFNVPHCLKHACNMNGVETVDQIDRHPLEVCPDCMAKICWTGRVHPRTRYERLVAVSSKLNLRREAGFYRRCLQLL